MIFAYTALYLIGPFSIIFPTFYLPNKIGFLRMFIWELANNIPSYILNYFFAFILSLSFIGIKLSLSNLPVLAYIFFIIIFKIVILLEIYAYNVLDVSDIGLLSGQTLSIIISSYFAYLGWKTSFTFFRR